MLRPWLRAFGFCLLMLPGPPASAQDETVPKAIAFVVGVQRYDDAGLNELKYTARDARDVFEKLRMVTDLDLERSRLLLADPTATDTADPGDPEWMLRRNRLELRDIQQELRKFLVKIEDNETVLFYFGGHGTTQARQHLLFLASDYVREPKDRYWRYNDIIDDIRGYIDEKNLVNVRVVFFANMCGAGTAAVGHMGEGDDELDAEFVEDWQAKNTLGFKSFALFPASAPNTDTFERPELERSIFAYHLLEGLSRAARNGVITADSLFAYLDANIEDELPKRPGSFDGTIRIGVTRELEARALYLDGLSLLSEALDTDDPLYWQLARRDLEQAATFAKGTPLEAGAALKLAQLRAAQGAGSSELADILSSTTRSVATDPDIRAEAAGLLEAAKQAAAERFAAVIVTSERADRQQRWRTFLEQFPGYSLAETVLFPLQEYEGEESRREEQVLSALAELKKEHEGSHLVFIYTGTAGFNSLSERYPFDLEAYHSFVQQWAGPVTIIYDAPFGGFLKREFEAGGFSHVSLILAAQETNGMTFIDQTSPFQGDGTEILIRMIESGVTDVSGWAPFDSYRSEVAEYTLPALDATDQQLYGASSWVIGTPSIDLSGRYPSPVFSRAKRSRSEAYAKLDPVRRLASLIATGCDMRADASCEEFSLGPVEMSMEVDGITATLERLSLAGPEVPAQRVFDLLKAAALRDYGGEMEDAFATYDQFLQRHDMVHGGPVAELRADEANLREQVRESVDRITGQVRERLDGLQGKFTRQIWLLLAGVPDYRSPLVSDLVDAGGDLLAWESALHDVKADEFPITPRQIDTSSRPEMLVSLGQALAEAGSDDLVLFIFSGRGIEIAGERYLATANVLSGFADAGAPAAALLGRPSQGQVLPTMDELVSIAEVAEVARDRWFVGIYDAQFTQPVFEPGRMDGVLDKHLNSVRPSPPETAATQIATSMELERFPVSAKDFLGKHVHIWWEGSLTERLTPPTGCQADPVRKVRSPMTAALLAALQEEPHGTYRDWILRAQEHPCLGAAAGFGFVAQGSTDLPRFASGTAATQIPYFLSARERRDANLHAADAVTQFTSKGGDHPLFALSRAAVLLARVEFARSAPSEAELEQSDWLTAALGLLVRLRQSEKDKVQEAGLDAEVLDLYARALVLNGEDDQARSILLAAPPPQLASKTLQDRLLDLTEAELRQSPTGILEATGAKLADLGASANPDVSTRFEALSSLYEAPRGQYRIITPTILSP